MSVPCWLDSPDWGRVSVKALSTLSPALFEAAKKFPPRELRSLQLNIIHNMYCICYISTNVFLRVFQMYFSGLLAKHMRGAYIRPNFEMGTNLRNHSYCWRNFNNFSRQYIFAFMRPEEWGGLVCSTMCYISTSGNLYFGFIKLSKRCWVTKSSEKDIKAF